MNTLEIAVPGSSANIGPGFDSIGIAVNRYLTLQVTEQKEWEFIHTSPLLPKNSFYKDHFIFQVAEQVANDHNQTLPASKVVVNSEIPLARGLGSSASAIIAGIEMANSLCNLSLSEEDKLRYGTNIEGHPDNVAASLFGGLIIAVQTDDKIEHLKLDDINMDMVVYVPNFELKTSAAREVLPEHFSREKAAYASGVSNLMLTALIAGDYQLAGKMMEYDQFHEPYRARLIPNYETIRKQANQAGAFGTVISGAGPTMISFVPKEKANLITAYMSELLPNYQVETLTIATDGSRVNQKLL